jgi:quinoprotein glucose dehydrogenase
MSQTARRLVLAFLCLTAVVRAQTPTSNQPSTKNGDWPHYTADNTGSRYSPLAQIDASNFGKLEVAWRYKTDNLGPRPEYKLEGTPVAIKGVLYTTGGTRRSWSSPSTARPAKSSGRTASASGKARRRPRRAQLSGRGVSLTDGKGD